MVPLAHIVGKGKQAQAAAGVQVIDLFLGPLQDRVPVGRGLIYGLGFGRDDVRDVLALVVLVDRHLAGLLYITVGTRHIHAVLDRLVVNPYPEVRV